MSDDWLQRLEELIGHDVNWRGLARDPHANLLSVCRGDLGRGCRSLAQQEAGHAAIVTGFWIPSANAAETDGPIGAVFIARVLAALGWRVSLHAEPWCADALALALQLADGGRSPVKVHSPGALPKELTHLIAVERVGPSYLAAEVPEEHRGQCHTMRGRIVTPHMAPLHEWFAGERAFTTIGIGDGGNEIGMGKVPREIIARNIENGGLIACRIATDHNIVCGISNWGAYALAAGAWRLHGRRPEPPLFDLEHDRRTWQRVLEECVLVDGMTGRRELAVDGLSWDEHARPLRRIFELAGGDKS